MRLPWEQIRIWVQDSAKTLAYLQAHKYLWSSAGLLIHLNFKLTMQNVHQDLLKWQRCNAMFSKLGFASQGTQKRNGFSEKVPK